MFGIQTILNILFVGLGAGLLISFGFRLGKRKSKRHYVHAIKSLMQQTFYWRQRYFQTLADYQELTEEKKWVEGWCPDDKKEDNS